MVTLDDTARFVKVLALNVPWAHTWADTSPGKTDLERREAYRKAAIENISLTLTNPLWWAFRITVEKAGRPLDVDNVPKTIIDAFCARQIARDGSSFSQLGLYPDDSFDHVRIVQVIGARGANADSTLIEVFACIQEDVGSSQAEPATEMPITAKQPEQNGVRRPKPETLCGQAWAIFDELSQVTIGEALEIGRQRGLNEGNVRAEFYQWRKFNGIHGRRAKL